MTKQKFKTTLYVLLLTAYCLLITGSCASAPKRYVYQEDKEWVIIRQARRGDIQKDSFNHPKDLPQETWRKVLSTVYCSYNMFVSLAWSKPLEVFNDRQLDVLSSAFYKAFLEMDSEQEIEFAVRREDKKSRETRGRAFIKDNELNLVFNYIDRPAYWGKDPGEQRVGTNWKLVPRDGQRLFATRSDDKGKNKHWLIIPMDKWEDISITMAP